MLHHTILMLPTSMSTSMSWYSFVQTSFDCAKVGGENQANFWFTSMANRWPQCAIEIDYVKIRRIANLGDFPPSKNPVKVSVIRSFYATSTLHNWRNILQFKVLWKFKRIIDPTKFITHFYKFLTASPTHAVSAFLYIRAHAVVVTVTA